MVREVDGLDSNKSFSAALIKEHQHIDESLMNIHLFSAQVEPIQFKKCNITNIRSYQTDFELLCAEYTTLSESTIKNAEVSSVLFIETTITNSNFYNVRFEHGTLRDNIIFNNCKFDKVIFINTDFIDVSFNRCDFIDCAFIGCTFSGTDSPSYPELNTQNTFLRCNVQSATFKKCSFIGRVSTYSIPQTICGFPSKSLVFTDCSGYIDIKDTVEGAGIDVRGFNGTVGNKKKTGNIKRTNRKAIGVDTPDYTDPWDNVCGINNSKRKEIETKKKPIKKDYPIRFISEGL